MKWWALTFLALNLPLAGCGDDDDDDATGDGDADADGDGDGDGDADPVARGDYLVNHVIACVDCHTPRDETGAFDMTKVLAGAPLIDVDPKNPDVGALFARNLTPDAETGLGNWSDEEIITAFRDGVRPDGRALAGAMPYWVFHNMSDEDAAAIVAYLRSLPAVSNAIPDPQAPWLMDAPAPTLTDADIPHTTLADDDPDFASAERGRYLAAKSGLCIDCHTPESAPGVPDFARPFAGGREFPRAMLGLPDIFPEIIYTANITPDATGIQGWAPESVVAVLHTGVDVDGAGICPPMPTGPMGAYGGLTDEDALDIANYITTLPPIENAIAGECAMPAN